VITELDGNGRPVKTLDRRWRKPLFLLINAGTRSAKEVVAFSLKRHSIATLVGERTAGAVVSGTVYWLADRSILALPVDEGLIDGERLEGKGQPLRLADMRLGTCATLPASLQRSPARRFATARAGLVRPFAERPLEAGVKLNVAAG
jgi:Peptidase family S41